MKRLIFALKIIPLIIIASVVFPGLPFYLLGWKAIDCVKLCVTIDIVMFIHAICIPEYYLREDSGESCCEGTPGGN